MRSFDSLKLAEGFMLETGSRAIGFFSSPESTEHSVYLTVAEQLSRSPSTAPKLARATIGRGTKGCTIYMIPSASALTPSGSYVAPLLQHRFVLPASAADYRGLEMRHQSIPGSSAPGADGVTSGAWETMLEDEAMRLHRFLQAGALRSVSELTAAAMEGPAPLLDAAAVGLLLLPRGASASVRDYHLRRLRKLADSFPRWSCDSSEPPGGQTAPLAPSTTAPAPPAPPARPTGLAAHSPSPTPPRPHPPPALATRRPDVCGVAQQAAALHGHARQCHRPLRIRAHRWRRRSRRQRSRRRSTGRRAQHTTDGARRQARAGADGAAAAGARGGLRAAHARPERAHQGGQGSP